MGNCRSKSKPKYDPKAAATTKVILHPELISKPQYDPNAAAAAKVILLPELILEVLSFLPVEYLMRMKCVCKSLISDPTFIKMHFNRSARNPHLALLISTFRGSSILPIPVSRLLENCPKLLSYDLPYFDMLVGSCVGNNYRKTFFYFCNPATTKISNKLGFFEEGLKDTVPNFFNFAFGYDDSTDTYKVVAFRPGGTEVRVFNLGDNYFWRDIQNSPGVPFSKMNSGVYLSGCIHWLALYNYSHSRYKWEDISIGQIFIISLDLRTETYTELMLPSGLNEVPREAPILRVLKNCLCFSHDFEGTHLIIWQMIEYGVKESWTQLLKISYEVLQNIHHNLETGHYSYCLPLYLCDTLVFANDSEEHAILYNMRDNSVERTSITIPKSLWMEAKDYVESLVWYS